MKDVYKDAMDAIKAPDALAQKTLKLMLEEHKKLEMKNEVDAGLKELDYTPAGQRSGTSRPHSTSPQRTGYPPHRKAQPSPRKNRWITHVALPIAACLCLLLSVTVPGLLNRSTDVHNAPVDTYYGPGLATPALEVNDTDGATKSIAEVLMPDNLATQNIPATETPGIHGTDTLVESVVEALVIDNLATRSGPATKYRETGTYQVKGEYVSLISLAYGEDGTRWVQCEVRYGDKLRRVYTGLQRFDEATFDLGSVPEEDPLDDQAEVTAAAKAMYGPGQGYDTYAELTVDEGQTVTIIAIENEYAQVEWTTSKQSYRAWVPVHTLSNR